MHAHYLSSTPPVYITQYKPHKPVMWLDCESKIFTKHIMAKKSQITFKNLQKNPFIETVNTTQAIYIL